MSEYNSTDSLKETKLEDKKKKDKTDKELYQELSRHINKKEDKKVNTLLNTSSPEINTVIQSYDIKLLDEALNNNQVEIAKAIIKKVYINII